MYVGMYVCIFYCIYLFGYINSTAKCRAAKLPGHVAACIAILERRFCFAPLFGLQWRLAILSTCLRRDLLHLLLHGQIPWLNQSTFNAAHL